MIFEDALRDLLVQAGLVGNRVFLMRAPQKPAPQMTTPYQVFLGVGPSPLHTQEGPLNVLDRTYQISTFDLSQSRALALADSLREYLDGMSGDYQGFHIGGIFFRAQSSAYESDTLLFQAIQDYRILFQTLAAPRANQPIGAPTA